jgi:hypothetical protein
MKPEGLGGNIAVSRKVEAMKGFILIIHGTSFHGLIIL